MAVILTDLTVFKESLTNVGYTTTTQTQFGEFVDFMERENLEMLFGNAFASAILASPSETIYKTLIDGGAYSYAGQTYNLKGIRTMLKHFISVQYNSKQFFQNTPSGNLQPLHDNAEAANPYMAKETFLFNIRVARKCYEELKDYINRNASDYEDIEIKFTRLQFFEWMF